MRNHRVAAIDFATVHSWVDKCAFWHALSSPPPSYTFAIARKKYSFVKSTDQVMVFTAGWMMISASRWLGSGSMPRMRRP